ncbi:MAG: response regulator [Cyclobacteriaceae bacterium]
MAKDGLILFVDDEYYVLQTLKAIFRRDFRNYQLEFAQSGIEAMEVLEMYEDDELKELVVFSDWLMPGVKGDELCIQIHQKYPQSVNFLLSGMINKEPTQEVFQQGGVKQVIQKPWDNETLMEILNQTLKKA